MNRIFAYLLILPIVLSTGMLFGEQAKELGNVNWLRNYDQAVAASKQANKPIFLLFQEVPGCQGCIDFGQSTLTNQLIVDAIESSFIPLSIYNNKGGHDQLILKRFKEPAWNFQVVRYIDSKGSDLIPRKDRVWAPSATAARMITALQAARKPVPYYLYSVAWSQPKSTYKTAAFSMYCFWDGEAKLGAIPGVLNTEAGWIDGHEVVRLSYDTKTITWPELVELAGAQGCARLVYAPDSTTLAQTPKGTHSNLYTPASYRIAQQSDQKRHLQFSKLKSLMLNPIQRTKINAALMQKDLKLIEQWLSPSQLDSLYTQHTQQH